MLPPKILHFITVHILIDQMDTLSSIQANNCYHLSKDVARIKENNTGIKAVLAASNEPCWEITSGACVMKKGNKFQCYIRARKHPNSVRGNKKCSLLFIKTCS